MARPEDIEMEKALAALARDVAAGTPVPGEDMTADVLADGAMQGLAREIASGAPVPGQDLTAAILGDAALQTLAREAALATPRPTPDLIARVLADASEMRAPVAAAASGPTAPVRDQAPGFFDLLFGWTGGAVAAMALCLSVGVSVGMEIDPADLPMMDEEADEIVLTSEGDLLPEEFL